MSDTRSPGSALSWRHLPFGWPNKAICDIHCAFIFIGSGKFLVVRIGSTLVLRSTKLICDRHSLSLGPALTCTCALEGYSPGSWQRQVDSSRSNSPTRSFQGTARPCHPGSSRTCRMGRHFAAGRTRGDLAQSAGHIDRCGTAANRTHARPCRNHHRFGDRRPPCTCLS